MFVGFPQAFCIRLLKARLKVLLKVLVRLLKARLKVLPKVLVRLLEARLKLLLKVIIKGVRDRTWVADKQFPKNRKTSTQFFNADRMEWVSELYVFNLQTL